MTVRSTRWRVIAVALLVVAGFALGGTNPVTATYLCGDETTEGGTIVQSVVVPENGLCQLFGVTIRGSVTIQPGGFVRLVRSEVRGGVVATQPQFVEVGQSVIRGGFTVTGATMGVYLAATEVRGNVDLTDNRGFQVQDVSMTNTTVRGNATVSRNDGSVYIEGNTVRANLACVDNTNVTAVRFNSVGGTATGQCALP